MENDQKNKQNTELEYECEFEGEESVDYEAREKILGLSTPQPIYICEESVDYEAREKIDKISNEDNDISEEVYPDAEVNIAREPVSAFQLKRKYDQKPSFLILDPDFQRESHWNIKQKSELIESILMGIPLPSIYVKENVNGVYIIVDGRQRLTTLFDFMNNKFKLKKIKILNKYNNKEFQDLEQQQQNKIEDSPLTLHVIKPPTKDRVTFDLFDRVNRGGTRLNNQEMRNALYQGKSTQLLKKLAKLDSFKKVTDSSINSERMKDQYLILRFLSFYLWEQGTLIDMETNQKVLYRSDMEDFLSKSMLFINKMKSTSNIADVFEITMEKCLILFGRDCFRLPKEDRKAKRPINMALFETKSYFISLLIDVLDEKSDLLKQKYEELMNDNEYIKALTYIVDSNKSIKMRFDKISEKIEEIKNA